MKTYVPAFTTLPHNCPPFAESTFLHPFSGDSQNQFRSNDPIAPFSNFGPTNYSCKQPEASSIPPLPEDKNKTFFSSKITPLTPSRKIRSTHSQTTRPVSINISKSTQTENKHSCIQEFNDNYYNYAKPLSCSEFNVNEQVIFSCNAQSPSVPLVPAQLAKENISFLVDSGSSLSLLSADFFNNNKQYLKYKYLGSRVKIQTVNSQLYCQGSIECSLKISNNFYKHHFHIVELPPTSLFQGILGYDFIKKFNIIISPKDEILVVDNHEVKLLSQDPRKVHNFHLSIRDDEPLIQPGICYAYEKCIIPPHSSQYIKLKSEFHGNAEFLLFQASLNKQNIQMQQSIINNSLSDINYSLSENNIIPHQLTFYTLIENNNDESFHINKNMKVGFVSEIENIKNDEHDPSTWLNTEMCNLIMPSQGVKNLRKQEVQTTKFKLDHMSTNEAKVINKIIHENYLAFSSSTKSLGHTDRITPKITFSSDCAIKALPFPVPSALQDEAKQQIDELIEAGIIERTLSDWSAPMLLVQKKKASPQDKPSYRLAIDLRLINSIIQPSGVYYNIGNRTLSTYVIDRQPHSNGSLGC